jgi:hypothetical protein
VNDPANSLNFISQWNRARVGDGKDFARELVNPDNAAAIVRTIFGKSHLGEVSFTRLARNNDPQDGRSRQCIFCSGGYKVE